MRESRFSLSAAKQYAKFLESKSSENTLLKRGSNSPPSIDENIKLWNQLGWNEKWYLQKYEDVAEAVQYGWYKNGHDHYIKVGRALGRTDKIETNNIITELPSVNFPPKWDEVRYLKYNSDVLRAVNQGIFTSGYFHYDSVGRFEGRLGGLLTTEPREVVTVPPNWDENLYLKHNVDLRKLIKDESTSMVMLILSKKDMHKIERVASCRQIGMRKHIFASTKMWLRPFKTQSILVDMIITLVLATLRA